MRQTSKYSVQLMGGILRDLQAFLWLQVFSARK